MFLILGIELYAQPPKPPKGKRWVLNEKFSDEFNGNELDLEKWYNYHPNWVGRPPGIFLPSQISVENGMLVIKGGKMAKDTIVTMWNGDKITYNIACGAVVSKSNEASFGYYESKVKVSKSTLSTTFWLSTHKNVPLAETPCDDKYGLELDIMEMIGRTGNFPGSYFANRMNSNTHFWYTDCDNKVNDLRSDEIIHEINGTLPSDQFYIYGAWWQDEQKATFYLDGNEPKSVDFNATIKNNPFDQPMHLHMVTETYPFPWVSLPTDEELADDTKNTSYYDWVRSYKLVNVLDPNDEPVDDEIIKNSGFESGDLTGWVGWPNPYNHEVVSDVKHINTGNHTLHIAGAGSAVQKVSLKPNTEYKLSCYAKIVSGNITLGIKEGVVGGSLSVNISNSNYTLNELVFTTDGTGSAKLFFYAPSVNDEGYADDFLIEETNPVIVNPEDKPIVQIYNEKLEIDVSTLEVSNAGLNFDMVYQANKDREIYFELKNSSGTVVEDNIVSAYAGYAYFNHDALTYNMASNENYYFKAQLRPVGGQNTEGIMLQEFVIRNGAILSVVDKIDLRNNVFIYPNPVKDSTCFSEQNYFEGYVIYKANGAKVEEGIVNKKTYN
ncbi:carbohydrate binding domain-containing protein [Flavivirga rizhaonensis]|uniref:carbohydrate binding domain-containing protein n=1 Tax=Flavivirga rizhaonensis TaxID=2559571 RepID=UPI0014772EB3|nr:carbohydrate binding domain-containing protein [Flavivirga rizhaonensis]